MQSPIQSSLSSPSQDHGYCSNTNGNDRQVLEKNLEKLISERGMEVIGQLTKEMSPQQIERLLMQTKQKLQGASSVPLGATAEDVRMCKSSASGHTRGSMNDVYHKHSSSDEDEEEEETDMSVRKASAIKQHRSSSSKDQRLNGSAKNLSVRFDPSQVQTSPHMEHHAPPPPAPVSHREHRGGGGGGHRHHRKGHHHGHSQRSRRAVSRQPERANYYHHQPMIPRSHSYSGQVGLQESLNQCGQQPVLSRHQSPHVGRRPPPMMQQQPAYNYSNYHPTQGFVEDDDVCSTCSSSSSDSDDPYAYQLPTRKAYGGVRLSYVPNDRIRARHHQRSLQQNQQEYVSQRHSLRGNSMQPQSLPPAQHQLQQRHHQHHHNQPQLQQPLQVVHHQHQQQQQQTHSNYHPHQPSASSNQAFAHPGPPSGSSVTSKDKEKCIIS